MAFDESLYVTAKFTTARGLALSKQSNALTIKDTSVFTDVVINRNYLGTGGFDSGWYVKRSLNLNNVFTDIMRRQPFPGENIRFILESDVAAIGGNINDTPYVYSDAGGINGGSWENAGIIELHNYGWISGRGAMSGYMTHSLAGTAIVSFSPLTVYNYGLITGGGGCGGIYGGGWGILTSGAGAPYGHGLPPDTQSATLLQPSEGQLTTGWSRPFQSGKGGAPGEPGETVPPINWGDLTHPGSSGGLPGFISNSGGMVTIINKGSGITKGLKV